MEKAAMTCPHIAQQTMIRFSVLQELGKIWRMGMSEDERDYFTKFGTSIWNISCLGFDAHWDLILKISFILSFSQ